MLILTRRLGERIIIGEEIRIAILDIKGSQVRIGIEAPLKTSVHREEVYERIKEENILAASLTPKNITRVFKAWKKDKT